MKDSASRVRPAAVVIGSGFGGLGAAVRLSARGYDVTVLEKLDAPGGRAYTFHQDGFTFDAGPTIITAPYLFEELWQLCGKRFGDDVDLRPIDPFYKIRFDDGAVFTYSGDIESMRREVARFEPADVTGFDRFMAASEEIFAEAYTELAAQPFEDLGFTLKTMPELVRLGGHRSVYQMVCKYFKNPKLRIVFSFHPLLIGGNPLSTTAYYCLIATLERSMGVHYAMGGTGALIRGLVTLLEGNGGRIRYNAEVSEITTRDGKARGVKLASGEEIGADIVVSNADAAWTYKHLLARHKRKRWTDAKVERQHYSMSLFVWYFGTNKRFDDVYQHLMVLGPRYEELLRDIFNRKKLAEDFSLYLHRPTMNDPALAPEGCDAFYVLSPVPHLQSGVDWHQQAEAYRAKVQQRLEQTVLPGLGDSIVTSRMLTPQDFHDRLNSVNGAAFSIEPRLFQSAWFRPHNRSEDLENLFLVGGGTHPGAGVPGVLNTAKVVDSLVPDASVFAE